MWKHQSYIKSAHVGRILTRALRRADCHLWEGVLRLMDTCLDNAVSKFSSLPLNRFVSFACNASLVEARYFQQNFPQIIIGRIAKFISNLETFKFFF